MPGKLKMPGLTAGPAPGIDPETDRKDRRHHDEIAVALQNASRDLVPQDCRAAQADCRQHQTRQNPARQIMGLAEGQSQDQPGQQKEKADDDRSNRRDQIEKPELVKNHIGRGMSGKRVHANNLFDRDAREPCGNSQHTCKNQPIVKRCRTIICATPCRNFAFHTLIHLLIRNSIYPKSHKKNPILSTSKEILTSFANNHGKFVIPAASLTSFVICPSAQCYR